MCEYMHRSHVHLPEGLVGALDIFLGYLHRFSMFMSGIFLDPLPAVIH